MKKAIFEPSDTKRVDKPWGHEIIWAKTDRYVGKILHVNRGESLSLQYHKVKEETLYLFAGSVKLTLEYEGESQTCTMRVGEAFHVFPGLIHRMEALEDSDIAEVSTPELDDVVRLEDKYGRKGTSEA